MSEEGYRILFAELFQEKIGLIPSRPDRKDEERRFREAHRTIPVYHEREIDMLHDLTEGMAKEEREDFLRYVHKVKKIFNGYVADPVKAAEWSERERRRIAKGIEPKYRKGWRPGDYPMGRQPGRLKRVLDAVKLRTPNDDESRRLRRGGKDRRQMDSQMGRGSIPLLAGFSRPSRPLFFSFG